MSQILPPPYTGALGVGREAKKGGIRTPVPCVTFIDQAELLSLCLSKTPQSGQGWMESRWNHGSLFLMFRTVGLSGYVEGESARAMHWGALEVILPFWDRIPHSSTLLSQFWAYKAQSSSKLLYLHFPSYKTGTVIYLSGLLWRLLNFEDGKHYVSAKYAY